MGKVVYFLIEKAIGTWNATVQNVLSLLTQSPEAFRGGTGWQVVRNLHPLFVAIASGLVTLFFIMGVIGQSVDIKSELRMENIVKLFIRLFGTQILVVYGLEVITALFQSVGAMAGLVINGATFTGITLAPEIQALIENVGFFEGLLSLLIAAICALAVYVLSYMLLFIVYFRFFKIYVAVILSPLAFAPMAGHGFGFVPRQFGKYIVSVSLEAIVMILSILVFSAIVSSTGSPAIDSNNIGTVLLYLFELLFGMFVTVGGMKVADQTVKSIFGL